MKRIFVILALFVITIFLYGQTCYPIPTEYNASVYQCDKLNNDIKYYNHFYNNFCGDFVKWAEAIKNVFPKDKYDQLHYTYILNTNSKFDRNQVMRTCADWYDKMFGLSQYYFIEKTENCIKGKGKYEYIS